MMNLLLFILVSYGVTSILVHGSIFSSLRMFVFRRFRQPWNSFFMCPLCVGFWAGLLVSLTGMLPVTGFFFYDGCIAAGVAHMITTFFAAKKNCSGCSK